jgi:PhnB protein
MMSNAKPNNNRYNTLQPYLIVRHCAAAIAFYEAAFGATERMRMPRPDGRIGHAEMQIGDTCIMMADEHPEINAFGPDHYGGSSVSLHFFVNDCDVSFQQAIAAGAKEVCAPADQPYGDRNAGVLDPFGYKWWMAAHIDSQRNEAARKLEAE